MNRYYRTFSIVMIIAFLLPAGVYGRPIGTLDLKGPAVTEPVGGPPAGFDPASLRLADQQPVILGAVGSSGRDEDIYFVILADPAVPGYLGGIPSFAATHPQVAGDQRLDLNSPQVRAYSGYLMARQDEALNQIQGQVGRSVDVRHRYLYALNGLALRLTSTEADAIARLPGVKSVHIDQAYRPETDVSPEWVGASGVWDGSASGDAGTKGEGIIIGIIDTGINMDHPSFAALGEDSYVHENPFGSGNYIGWCHSDPSYVCNDKLIGAWDYADASWGEGDGPNDNNGHGSHTASTAAGNWIEEAVLYGPTTSFSDTISGIAPHANIIAYDACGSSCYDTDVIAAIDQAIVDGVDVINESIGVGGDAFTGPKQMAYLNALAAGIFYARSAGNDGPDPATVGPEPAWTLSTAALTHNRLISNSLMDLTGGALPLGDLIGAGFTVGYGPAPIVYAGDYLDTLKAGATAENARLCAMGNGDDMVFETPWEAGTFSGEIVVCDRGIYPRVEKGANVGEVGGGGFVLADNGDGVVSDAHYIPGLHISQADGEALKSWLDPMIMQTATISGYTLDYSPANGDLVAGFSSRGPGGMNFIKPDAGAPGVAIWAAYADNPDGPDDGREFGFLGGTSMASPHMAGMAALVKAAQPTWTPTEIKSALMTTAQHSSVLKDDGVTASDPFDTGSGSVRVDRAVQAGLLLDESLANFSAASEANAASLNLPSLADEACFSECSWTRRLENALSTPGTWTAALDNPEGVLLSIEPAQFTLEAGGMQTITVTATITNAVQGEWLFGSVTFVPDVSSFPDTYLPLALYASSGSDVSVLSKEVDLAEVDQFGTLNYTLTVSNPSVTAVTYILTDTLPAYSQYVDGSAWGGLTYDPAIEAMTWQGSMVASSVDISRYHSSGYVSLTDYGIEPFDKPADLDEGGWLIGGVDFWYLGDHYAEGIWSINGTLEAGSASGVSVGRLNGSLPSITTPNNLLAPWWSDINFTDGGEWYLGTLTDGTNNYDVFEWKGVPRWGTSGTQTASFQIWLMRGTDQIWFEYASISTAWTTATVGVEDASGSVGEQYYYNGGGTKPSPSFALVVEYTNPEPLEMGFAAQVEGPSGALIVNQVILSDQDGAGYVSRAISTLGPRHDVHIPLIIKKGSGP